MSWYHPFHDVIPGYCTTGKNIINFWGSQSWDNPVPHSDMLSLQSARHSGCRTKSTRCAESPGAIHFMIQPLDVQLQTQTSPLFGIQNAMVREFPTLICSRLQSARAKGYRTRPIDWAQSPGIIHFMIGLLAAEIQPQTSPIFEIQNAVIREFPTLICSYYRRPVLWDIVLYLSNEPNLLVSFISWSDYWPLRYSNKHHQFSEFTIPG